MRILIPVSLGELYDKISILEIKREMIPDKYESFRFELELLIDAARKYPIDQLLYDDLKIINKELWNIEDRIREKERNKEFDDEFIELARSVYFTNDNRSNIKKTINTQYGSDIVEVKSYKDY